MFIRKVYFNDIGYCAKVSPETEPNLEFSVRGKYIDTYLERILEYQAEQELKDIYPEYDYTAQMFAYESITTPWEELYQLYEKYGRPANWNELPKYIQLERLRINTKQYIDENLINDIINKIPLLNFKTSVIEIYDGNKLYSFQYDALSNTFTSK